MSSVTGQPPSTFASADLVYVQGHFAGSSTCFGCGPANDKGLRIKSQMRRSDLSPTGCEPKDIRLTALFQAEPHHEAFPGMVNGGICGALLDCHSNWTAAVVLMRALGLETPPCTVTADFHVMLKRPTPSQSLLSVEAWPVEIHADRVKVEALIRNTVSGKITATCTGLFVAVKEGHPAYHRW